MIFHGGNGQWFIFQQPHFPSKINNKLTITVAARPALSLTAVFSFKLDFNRFLILTQNITFSLMFVISPFTFLNYAFMKICGM